VVVYLPSMSQGAHNTTTRIAEIISADLTLRRGTFGVASLDHASPALSDGRRILDEQDRPVLDFFTVAYRDKLTKVAQDPGSSSVLALAKLLLVQVTYFLRALTLFAGAGRRAKSAMAKWQLVVGFGAVVLLLLGVLVTVSAILVALGVIDAPKVNDTFAEVFAIGATAVITWLLARAAPTIRQAATLIQQLLDYAEDARQAVTVVTPLGEGLDALLEDDEDREIFILGYSLGSLVALDYLCPRKNQYQRLDDRHTSAIRGLITIGSPLDFVRLYMPKYIDNRQTRIPDLDWTNVFIPADVLGSNMANGNDYSEPTPNDGVDVGEIRPTETHQYTDETLNLSGILRRRGFLSHGEYWSEPRAGHCLDVVVGKVLPARV
jgi:hypothetical protein